MNSRIFYLCFIENFVIESSKSHESYWSLGTLYMSKDPGLDPVLVLQT